MLEVEGMQFEGAEGLEGIQETSKKDFDVELNIDEYQYFSFYVCKKLFAINILKIKEIITFSKITHVPKITNIIKGVLNTRGNILSVVDLATRFGLDSNFKYGKRACIIVVEVEIEDKATDVGLAIEEINSVITFMPEDLNDAPSYGTVVDSRFISKIGKHKKEFIPILDLETVLDIEELSTRNDIKGK